MHKHQPSRSQQRNWRRFRCARTKTHLQPTAKFVTWQCAMIAISTIIVDVAVVWLSNKRAQIRLQHLKIYWIRQMLHYKIARRWKQPWWSRKELKRKSSKRFRYSTRSLPKLLMSKERTPISPLSISRAFKSIHHLLRISRRKLCRICQSLCRTWKAALKSRNNSRSKNNSSRYSNFVDS